MKAIQNAVLEFIDNENERSFDDIVSLLDYQKTHKDAHELKSILYLISKISENHHRVPSFFEKIQKILDYLKPDIKQSFSNSEIYNIFKGNNRILLLLIDEEIFTMDESIFKLITEKDYFYPEIHKNDKNIELPDNFEEKRRIGENDSNICEIIRNDQIDDFIINFHKNVFSLTMNIEPSIFETNSFLIKRKPTIVKYTLFCGSIQIFSFLCQNNIKLEPSDWIYAIHGRNPEMIQFLKENKILPKDETYQECLNESIKCHHNEIATFIKDNLLIEKEPPKNDSNDDILRYKYDETCFAFNYYNFDFISEDVKDPICFFYAVDNGYFKLVDYYYKNMTEFLNRIIISMVYFKTIQKCLDFNIISNKKIL
ncbi:hypothetical protein M9Y10_011106 [Tritrichomonas musculus]|uniref:DUF3447 domain-containing protein n=1 Tax=Tritrichomonas musculus TaxID=1915356 RepID=A0ABR2INR3_9EUKA